MSTHLALLLATALAAGGVQEPQTATAEIVGLEIRNDRIVLRSDSQIGSVTAAPVEQERTVVLILGHRPSPALGRVTPATGPLIRGVELRTETSGRTVFTKVLIETTSPARATVKTEGALATIVMEPTDQPLLLPPTEDLFVEPPEETAQLFEDEPQDDPELPEELELAEEVLTEADQALESANPGPPRVATSGRMLTAAAVYLREGPGQRYAALSVVDAGRAGEIVASEDDWRELLLDSGQRGWVHEDFVETAETGAPSTLELELPAEVGGLGVRATPTASPEPPEPARNGLDRDIERQVDGLITLLEQQRGALQRRLDQALGDAEALRRERDRLESELVEARAERDRLRTALQELQRAITSGPTPSAEPAPSPASPPPNTGAGVPASRTAREAMDRALAAGKLRSGELVSESVLSGSEVRFTIGEAALSDEAAAALARFAEPLLADRDEIFIEIQGHTDASGDEDHNLRLGSERAEAVRRYLNRELGFPLHRMSVISYGETEPAYDNATLSGRQRNRRVVLVVLR